MKKILVPTDFSEAANNAAEYAVLLAKEIKAKVILFHIYHVPVPSTEVPIISISSAEIQKESEILLRKKVAQLKKHAPVEISYIARLGMAVDEIIEEEKKADLIIMGMRNVSKISEFLFGSITTATIRKTNTPVLVIPQNVKFKAPKKIVFSCDYNPENNYDTIETITELIKVFHSKLFVLNIKENKEVVSIEEAGSGLRLESKLNNVPHVYHFSENEDLIEGINKFVKEKKADMVVLIPHKHNLLERLFHKSISKNMAFHTNVPMLTLPEKHKNIPAYFL